MREKRWKFTDKEALRKLWKDYGNGLTFKEFVKWMEGEANGHLKHLRKKVHEKDSRE